MSTTTTKTDWTKPQECTQLEVTFGGEMRRLLPPYEEIPEDFRRERGESKKWHAIQSRWFFSGLPGNTEFKEKPGIDVNAALMHLGAIQGSFDPKHEHKQAAVAWLMSLWFDDVILPTAKP